MRFTVHGMLTSQSLAAFSASVQARARQNAAVQNVAVDATAPANAPGRSYGGPLPPPMRLVPPPPPRPPAGATPPRGTLLDLSV